MNTIQSIRLILKFYWQSTRPHKASVVLTLIFVTVATILYQVIPPIIIGLLVDELISAPHPSLALLAPFIGAYAAALLLGDVIGWRIVDHLHWQLEEWVSCNTTADTITKTYVRLADTTIYQVTPLIIGVLCSSISLFIFGSPYLWGVFVGVSILYIALTPVLTRKLAMIESRYHEQKRQAATSTHKTYIAMNNTHTVQQTILKLGITLFSAISLTIVLNDIINTTITIGIGVMALMYSLALARQLFTFSNNSIKAYRISVSEITKHMI